MEINFKDKFHNYIKAVKSGEWVAGKYQILAVERHLKDLKRKDIQFDIDEGERWCKFFLILKHTKGKTHANKKNCREHLKNQGCRKTNCMVNLSQAMSRQYVLSKGWQCFCLWDKE